ncbi:MAG: hypothetical protein IJC65_05080, partial [Oscillospiraceae bacterium]|nr:hypothetical protein [Oscillospiraceae bacterium]
IAAITSEEDSRDVIDELIDRYGDPPKSVMGLVSVALIRNVASRLGISEIRQSNDKVLFFIKAPTVEQITALSQRYKSRIRFLDGAKPHFAVTLDKNEKTPDLMDEVVRVMSEQG